jgi:hypothetical protein
MPSAIDMHAAYDAMDRANRSIMVGRIAREHAKRMKRALEPMVHDQLVREVMAEGQAA